MQTKTRYRQRLAERQRIRQSLIQELQFTSAQMFWLEVESGRYLLQYYLGELIDTHAGKPIVKQLEFDRNHKYWPWFINQKQFFDAEYYPQLVQEALSEHASVEIDPDHLKNHYRNRFNMYLRSETMQERLRHFITNSPTLFL